MNKRTQETLFSAVFVAAFLGIILLVTGLWYGLIAKIVLWLIS